MHAAHPRRALEAIERKQLPDHEAPRFVGTHWIGDRRRDSQDAGKDEHGTQEHWREPPVNHETCRDHAPRSWTNPEWVYPIFTTIRPRTPPERILLAASET